MPTPTYVALATTTLASDSATVTFSSIPATYRDLILVINGNTTRSGNANDINLTVNGSSTSYYYTTMAGDGSSTSIDGGSNDSRIRIANAGASATGVNVVQFFDYSATDKHKPIVARNNSAAWLTNALAGRWANTDVITSIAIASNVTGSIASGTTVSLYGIEA